MILTHDLKGFNPHGGEDVEQQSKALTSGWWGRKQIPNPGLASSPPHPSIWGPSFLNVASHIQGSLCPSSNLSGQVYMDLPRGELYQYRHISILSS